jgi:hypothetical protein
VADLNVTVVDRTPTCVVCGTYLRRSRSVLAGACCCCRTDHAPDYYVDLPLPEPATWQVSA